VSWVGTLQGKGLKIRIPDEQVEEIKNIGYILAGSIVLAGIIVSRKHGKKSK